MAKVKKTCPFRVLITRPVEDVKELELGLAARGVSCIIEPLLSVRVLDGPEVDLSGVSAVLVTSANGVRALARRVSDRSIRVFAVGDATARAAKTVGFVDIEAAAGNVASLGELVGKRMAAGKGALLHVAGSAVAGDLEGDLSNQGYVYRRCVLYEARTANVLPKRAAAAIEGQAINGVLLYSPRTARTFCRLVYAAGLVPACETLIAFCLSDAVAQEVTNLQWKDIVVAARSDQSAMIDAVTRAADLC